MRVIELKIGYIKIEKEREYDFFLQNILQKIIYKIHYITNKVSQDKYNKSIFYINNFSEKSLEKMHKLLSRNEITNVIVENKKNIKYPTIESNLILKYMLPELVTYCYEKIMPKSEEVYILVNKYSDENINIITELANKVKLVNIITENKMYYNLERKLEEKEIYITVSSNKRKSLKRAEVCINIDFNDLSKYSINNEMILIDTYITKIATPNFFNGIIIRGINFETKKIISKYYDFEDFDKQSLVMASILEENNYVKIRDIIRKSKLTVIGVKNKRTINQKEFERIRAKTIDKMKVLN